MPSIGTVRKARSALGSVGVLLPWSPSEAPSLQQHRSAAGRLEDAGYPAAWTNEVVGGKDALAQLAVLLASTRDMVFGTSIMNVWARAPQTAHAAAAYLTEGFGNRLVLGLGVGYPPQAASVGREFGSPVAVARDYVQQMTQATMPPAPDVDYPLLIGATGPRLTALAADISDGPLAIQIPAEYTAEIRATIGPDKLLVVGLPVVLNADAEQARAVARERLSLVFATRRHLRTGGRDMQVEALLRLGYSAQEIDEPSDRLVAALIAHGDEDTLASSVQSHLDAGADHVMVMSTANDADNGLTQLLELAPTLTQMS